ncbi:hypothetical protein AArcMg_3064 [Natrarchaeobaculum sulfurireducens]|uniref:Glycosyl hydrolase family 15 n=1 Tax=Natrarchaeobaculum sulfurireducens TaxID=2044521 RepID=A0A346PBT7_9EURY|nr:Glycosyl hydrolase family 15 [Natrarchaeobaculum sulfurireducens]AXR83051.1 hypothetical protein AArcMg_3064 [Natrarchaeobaculum sulfurireducens]
MCRHGRDHLEEQRKRSTGTDRRSPTGDWAEAIDLENVLECASPLGLYSEKVDPENGTLLGNFPQAFSHLGLSNSVTYLARALDAGGKVTSEAFDPNPVETLFRRGDPPEP